MLEVAVGMLPLAFLVQRGPSCWLLWAVTEASSAELQLGLARMGPRIGTRQPVVAARISPC